jgi:hypothetical protein
VLPRRTSSVALDRALDLAATDGVVEVERHVRAELLALLSLQDCWFTSDVAVDVPLLCRDGHLDLLVLQYRAGGFTLPEPATAIAVQASGRVLGHLVCQPTPEVGVSVARRRAAIALADVLGLALAGEVARSTP